MVSITLKRDKTLLEDRIVIHSKRWGESPHGFSPELIEGPNVKIKLVFKDGVLNSIHSAMPKESDYVKEEVEG